MTEPVHLDHAGASRPSSEVVRAMTDHLALEGRVGGYRAQAMVADRLEQARADVATLVGAKTDEVALVENATRGWTLAVRAAAAGWAPGDRVLVSRAEFGSCRLALDQLAAERGVDVEVIPDDEDGRLSIDGLRGLLDERVRLVALTQVASHVGTIHPVAEAAAVAGAAGALVVVDAAQSLGQLSVELGTIDADVLVGTGRKFLRGPRGVGVLVVRRPALRDRPPALPELAHQGPEGWRTDAARFETTESSVAARLGLGTAVRHLLDAGVDNVRRILQERRTALHEALAHVTDVTILDAGPDPAATIAFRVSGRPADEVRDHLAEEAVTVSVARPRHTPAGFDRPTPLVRASVHVDTTDDDIERLASGLAWSPR